MPDTKSPTVEFSLRMLSDAMGKAAEDLRIAREAVEPARLDITTRNSSVTRTVVKDAERVINHLREADESISDVMKDLQERG